VTCDVGSCDDTPTSSSDIELFHTKAVADIEANTDVEAAFVAMLALAKDGFAPAMNDVANLYSVGFGVGLDKREALRCWRRAASKGDMCAAINQEALLDNAQLSEDEREEAAWLLAVRHSRRT
jgi:TPR repeat protein